MKKEEEFACEASEFCSEMKIEKWMELDEVNTSSEGC